MASVVTTAGRYHAVDDALDRAGHGLVGVKLSLPVIAGRLRVGAQRLPSPVRERARHAYAYIPGPLRSRLASVVDPRAPRGGRPRWGTLRSLRPYSSDYGWDRGTPVDRVAIAAFHMAHARDIRGACLEVHDAHYTLRYGGGAVSSFDVLDIDPRNAEATVIADLGRPGSLPQQRYDCVLLTQTLHLIPDYVAALHNVFDALRPGGVVLLTAPTVSPHHPEDGLGHDLWRFTPAGLEHILHQVLPDAESEVQGYGNLITCVAFLNGLAAEELRSDELHAVDPRFPLVAAARIAKSDGLP